MSRAGTGGLIGIIGGAFDPVHIGHLRTAFELRESVGLAEVRFIPCGRPPHRAPPVAADGTRLQLLRAAIAAEPGFVIDDRELRRDGPSYTVDTLVSLQADKPGETLCVIVGMDAFLGLPTWHRWKDLLGLAHFIVATRPGWQEPAEGEASEILRSLRAAAPDELRRQRAGRILVSEVTRLDVSSSAIRQLLGSGGDPRYLVPEAVRERLLATGCYAQGRDKPAGSPGALASA
jgi:nicotinate-nucleotide adenylyltransferase